MRPGTVWITEDFDDREFGFLTGLFSAHWEGPNDDSEPGPQSVPVAEALTWGRARADVVLIRAGESGYRSAGIAQPEGRELPEWEDGQEFARRRAASAAYLDRAEDDEPILWQIGVQVWIAARELGGFPAAFNGAVAADQRAIDPIPYDDPTPDDGALTDRSELAAEEKIVHARFRLQARTWQEAQEVAGAIATAAFEAAVAQLGDVSAAAGWTFTVSAVPAD